MSVVNVYNIPQVVILSTGTGAQNMNFPVTRSDILIFKGVKNTIDLLIKDIDRKPVVLTGAVILRILKRGDRAILFQTVLSVVDPVKARYQAVFLPNEVAGLPLGYCDYTVTYTDASGYESPLFTDRDRADLGAVEIRQGGASTSVDAVEIGHDAFYPSNGFLYSSPLPGAAQVGNLSGVSSYVVFGNHFTGSVAVQGSLDDQPPTDDAAWLTIESHNFADLTGNQGFTFQGNYVWIRFQISDKTDPNAANAGSGSGSGGTMNCGCLTFSLCPPADGGMDDQGPSITPIDWPPGTPLGVVKIQFRA